MRAFAPYRASCSSCKELSVTKYSTRARGDVTRGTLCCSRLWRAAQATACLESGTLSRTARQSPLSLLDTCMTAFTTCQSRRWRACLQRRQVQTWLRGSSTAAFDPQFNRDQLEFNYASRQRGELRIDLAGKVFYLKVDCKAGKVSPELAQMVDTARSFILVGLSRESHQRCCKRLGTIQMSLSWKSMLGAFLRTLQFSLST